LREILEKQAEVNVHLLKNNQKRGNRFSYPPATSSSTFRKPGRSLIRNLYYDFELLWEYISAGLEKEDLSLAGSPSAVTSFYLPGWLQEFIMLPNFQLPWYA